MGQIPLSLATQKWVDIMFYGTERVKAAKLLVEECGGNIPYCEAFSPEQMERIRFAALKVSGGDLDYLVDAVDLAQADWRDLLVSAGFADDENAYKRWIPGNQRKDDPGEIPHF